MKKVLAVVLVAVMVLSLTACGSGISTGTYKLTSYKMGDTDLIQMYKDLGMDGVDELGSLVIKDDKNATISITGEDSEALTYDDKYFYSSSGEKLEYKASGSKITFTAEEDGTKMEMTFEK